MTMSLKLCAASVVVFTRQTNLMIMNAKGLKSNVTSADTQAQTMKDGTIAMRITAMTNSPMTALNKQALREEFQYMQGHYSDPADRDRQIIYIAAEALLDELEAAEKRIAEHRKVLNSLAAVARRYLPDYDEHPEIQAADELLEIAAGIGVKGE